MPRRRNWLLIGVLIAVGLLLAASIVLPKLDRIRRDHDRAMKASQLH